MLKAKHDPMALDKWSLRTHLQPCGQRTGKSPAKTNQKWFLCTYLALSALLTLNVPRYVGEFPNQGTHGLETRLLSLHIKTINWVHGPRLTFCLRKEISDDWAPIVYQFARNVFSFPLYISNIRSLVFQKLS